MDAARAVQDLIEEDAKNGRGPGRVLLVLLKHGERVSRVPADANSKRVDQKGQY
jgi:hypothetical protein